MAILTVPHLRARTSRQNVSIVLVRVDDQDLLTSRTARKMNNCPSDCKDG
jgi:hypothetical protein